MIQQGQPGIFKGRREFIQMGAKGLLGAKRGGGFQKISANPVNFKGFSKKGGGCQPTSPGCAPVQLLISSK